MLCLCQGHFPQLSIPVMQLSRETGESLRRMKHRDRSNTRSMKDDSCDSKIFYFSFTQGDLLHMDTDIVASYITRNTNLTIVWFLSQIYIYLVFH